MFRKIAMTLHLGSHFCGGIDPMVINIIREELGEQRVKSASVTPLHESQDTATEERKAA